MLDFLIRLQKIDRRWVYLFVFVACTVPFVLAQTKYKITLPVYESPEAKGVYDTVDKCPPDKVVMVDSSWDAGSMGENRGQVEVVFDHMLRNHTKFIVTAQNCPLAPQFSQQILDKLVADKYPNAKYGVDYANLGVVVGTDWQIMSQIASNIQGVYPKDVKGNPVDNLPIMKNVHNIKDIYMIHAVTYSPSENWLAFVYGPFRTPITFGCAGIQSTTYYRYVSSGQLKGMLVGIRGAAEYDAMLYPNDLSKRWSLGTTLIVPLAFGHLVVILAIIVGNIGFFAAQKRRA